MTRRGGGVRRVARSADQLVEIFGEEIGTAARAAVGMAGPPLGAAVEIDMVVAVAG